MSETTVISAEIIKKAMRIRSGIIIGHPNPCAYTDRFQEEYNALAVYLAVHYPDDKEISTYAPVFTEISTWEQAVKAANDGTVHKLVAVDDSINGHFDNNDADALRKFYYGRLDTTGEPGPLWAAIKEKTNEMVRDKDEIVSLFPHAKGLVDRVSEKSIDICSMQLYNEFAKGFKLGMQLTMEGMSEHHEVIPGKKIYTHDEAARVLDAFEEVLSRYDIHVPSPEDDEREPDNMVGLYGSTYSDLMDDIEGMLIDVISAAAHGAEVVSGEFSGNY